VFDLVKQAWMCDFDDAGSIGRRYRRQDEVGTPFCVTVDFDTLEDRQVTVRERDSMTQDRIPLENLVAYLAERL
jgi:glycyl-tRNA synthetase